MRTKWTLTISIEKSRSLVGIFIALLVELFGQQNRTTVELEKKRINMCLFYYRRKGTCHSHIGIRVLLSERREYSVPIRAAKVSGSPK